MESAKVSELKAFLSKYLAKVKNGEEVLVMERGKPIAKIVPLEKEKYSHPEYLKQMEKKGLIKLGSGKLRKEFWDLPRPDDPEGHLLKAVLEDREEGW